MSDLKRKPISLGAAALADEFENSIGQHTGLAHFYRWGDEWRTVIAALRASRPEGVPNLDEAFGAAFCNMDENGDPVGAQPEGSWEIGYAAGLRTVYRTLKARGIKLPSTPQSPARKQSCIYRDGCHRLNQCMAEQRCCANEPPHNVSASPSAASPTREEK